MEQEQGDFKPLSSYQSLMEFPSKTLQPLKYQISLEGGGHSNIPFNQRAQNTVPLTLIFARPNLVNSRIMAKSCKTVHLQV